MKGKTIDSLTAEERGRLTNRVYATLLELWGDQHGVDLRLVHIQPTDGPTRIELIEQ